MIVYLCGQVRYLYPVPVLQVQVYLYPGTLPVQVSAEQSYDRSIELSICFFYWFLLFIYYFITWHHMLSWHSGSQRVVQFASSVTNIVDFDDIGVFKNT